MYINFGVSHDLYIRLLGHSSLKFSGLFGYIYRTGANKGRGLYSKKIFWSIGAAYKQERLQFKKKFLKKINLLIHKTCYKSHQKMLGVALFLLVLIWFFQGPI